jgi:ribose 5-phosphate isomerase A
MNTKQMAGEKATEFVESGMSVGLGTGSTVYWTITRIGQMVKEGLKIRGLPTSKRTEELAIKLGIPLITFAEVEDELDLTIDGADEISPSLDLIKGGGGALLREKLVAAASRRLIIVADSSKRVSALGTFPMPVEIVPFAWEVTTRRIAALNCAATLRLSDYKPYVTDNGNYIVDCACGVIDDPYSLDRELKLLPGVVETGLFVGMADVAVVAGEDRIELIERPGAP